MRFTTRIKMAGVDDNGLVRQLSTYLFQALVENACLCLIKLAVHYSQVLPSGCILNHGCGFNVRKFIAQKQHEKVN